MSSNNCLQFFTEHLNNKDKCKELQKNPISQSVNWERETASPHSPGVVENDEILYRQMLNPIHFDHEKNEFKPNAFSDVSDKGGSVNRANHTSLNAVQQAADLRVAEFNQNQSGDKQRSVWGIIEIKCNQIRDIKTPFDENGVITEVMVRGFGVYDTALRTDISHADICQIVKGKAQAKSVRASLVEIANSILKKSSGVDDKN